MVKMLTVLVRTLSNSQVFLLKKNVSSFCKCKSYSHFFSAKNISVYAIFNDQSFNDTLSNDIVSFEQLGPDIYHTFIIAEPGHSISYKIACAPSEDLDQPAHWRRLIRAFAVHLVWNIGYQQRTL